MISGRIFNNRKLYGKSNYGVIWQKTSKDVIFVGKMVGDCEEE